MPKAPETNEIATTRDGRDITRGYVDPMQVLVSQDTVLQGRGSGDLSLYEEILRDDQVHATFQQRRLAVVSEEWDVEPGGTMRQDKKAADSLKAQLDALPFDDITDKMLFGVFYGFSVAECLWGRDGAEVVMEALKVRNRRRFVFGGDFALRLKTSASPQGEALPERKFWTFCCGADNSDEPYGRGLGHWLYWPAFFKRNGIKFWLIFLEKFGMPTAVGEYPPGTSTADQDKLLAATQAIQMASGVIVPQGMLLRLLEAARSGTADYTSLFDRMNDAIAKVTLGQTLTSEAKATGLGSGASATQMTVRQDLVKADADLVCQSFNEGPGRWLTEWNYPGAAIPRVWRRIEEPEDLNQIATRDKTLFDMGFRPTLQHIEDTYGGERTDTGPPAKVIPGQAGLPARDVAQAPPPAGDQAAAGFAEGEPREPPKTPVVFAERLSREAGPKVEALVAAVRKVAGGATSLEDLRDSLIDAAPDLDTRDFAQLMENALLAANLAGRFDVQTEETAESHA